MVHLKDKIMLPISKLSGIISQGSSGVPTNPTVSPSVPQPTFLQSALFVSDQIIEGLGAWDAKNSVYYAPWGGANDLSPVACGTTGFNGLVSASTNCGIPLATADNHTNTAFDFSSNVYSIMVLYRPVGVSGFTRIFSNMQGYSPNKGWSFVQSGAFFTESHTTSSTLGSASNSCLVAGELCALAATSDSNGVIRLYKNGTLKATSSVNAGAIDYGSLLNRRAALFNYAQSRGVSAVPSEIFAVLLWNGVTLTQAEIQSFGTTESQLLSGSFYTRGFTINGGSSPIAALSGPSTGVVGVASSPFTVSVGGNIVDPITFTPSDGGAGGTFSPTSVVITSSTVAATFTYTPATATTIQISVTNDRGVSGASPVTLTAVDPIGLTLTPPAVITGTVGVPSDLFQIDCTSVPSGTTIVTLSSSLPGSFSPASISLVGPSASSTASFIFTPSSAGSHVFTVDIPGFAVPASFTYSVSASSTSNVTNKYRFQQPLLFQRAHAKTVVHTYINHLGQQVTVPSATVNFNGSTSYGFTCGSTPKMLCTASKWMWTNYGGDWIDANGDQQGTVAFATSTTLPITASAGSVDIDITSALQYINSVPQWCALFIKISGTGTLRVHGPLNASATKSTIDLVTSAGSETLELWYAASMQTSTSYTNAQDDLIEVNPSVSGVMEFFRPTNQLDSVTSAILHLHYGSVSYATVQVKIFVVSPPLPNITAPVSGMAAGYLLDANISSNANVAVSLRVTDSTVVEDIIDVNRVAGGYSYPWIQGNPAVTSLSESQFDPYLWTATPGVGDFASVPVPTESERNNLIPRRNHGKFIGATWGPWCGNTFRVVHSDDATAISHGFTPLALGMGAIEVVYPQCDILNGQSSYVSLTTGSPFRENGGSTDLQLFFNEAHIGKVVDGYIRMYVQLGDGWDANDSSLANYAITDSSHTGQYPEEYGQNPQTATWRTQDMAGKFPGGIQQVTTSTKVLGYQYGTRLDSGGQPNDTQTIQNAGGGYSSSSGILGYQGRWFFQQGFYKQNHPGPACGGMALGVELYDFNGGGSITIPSQNYIFGWDGNESFATRAGGLGFFYPRKWYCVEMRWKMNTTKPYVLPARGTNYLEGGHNVDGFIEWWIDGVQATRTPLFAHRSTALIVDWALQNSQGNPFDTDTAFPHHTRAMTNVPDELFMGAAQLAFNAYYGGRTPNNTDKYIYINGIVVSNGQYIGPMAGVTRENGGLG